MSVVDRGELFSGSFLEVFLFAGVVGKGVVGECGFWRVVCLAWIFLFFLAFERGCPKSIKVNDRQVLVEKVGYFVFVVSFLLFGILGTTVLNEE